MLDDRKILVIQHLAEGEKTRTDIAKLVGISRQTLYDWLDDDEFKAELDSRLQQRKVLLEKIIDSKLTDMTEQLANLIYTTKNDRVKAQSIQYWLDRGLGKATSKHEITTDVTNNTNIDDDLLDTAYDDIIEHDDTVTE